VRRLLSPRWLAVHALALVLIAVCLSLGVWQYLRASGGNTLSWAYTFEWPLFAAFVVWMWVRAVRDHLSQERGEDPYAERRPPPIKAIKAVNRPVLAGDDDDPQLAAYNEYLAWLAANPNRKPSEYRTGR
jgi:DNA-binding transcriptional regulator of glucitol operon